MKLRSIIYLFCFFVLLSCEPEMESFKPSSGDADFSTVVAVGNSLTAGFADGELYRSAQLNSFPNIIAQQLQYVGGGDFHQPLMKDEYGFGNRLILEVINGELIPVPAYEPVNPGNYESIYDEKGPFSNFGVPDAKADHFLAPGYGSLNPYFERFAKNINTSSILNDAMMAEPTFFLLWIGKNDVLNYAIDGGEGETITNIEYFSDIMNSIIGKLVSNNSLGAVAGIPDITLFPFFTAIPSNGLLLTVNEAAYLNSEYEALDHIEFKEGANGFVVADPEAPENLRQLTEDELLLLNTPLDSIKDGEWGSLKPIPLQYYLSEEQIGNIRETVYEYNTFIEDIADEKDLAFVDVYMVLKEADAGIWFDGVNFTTQFITGGVFSLDGIHLTTRGNAVVANQFIDAINKKYNSSIPKVSVTDYQGIVFP